MNQAKSFLYLLLSVTFLAVMPTYTKNPVVPEPCVTERDAFDDLLAFADSPEVSDVISHSDTITRVQSTSKQAVLTAFYSFGLIPVLQENFFLRSNNLKTRSLLDYPEFIPFRHDLDCHAVYVDLFYNQTSRAFFTKESGNICSYLALTSASLRQKIQNILNELPNVLPEEVQIDSNQVFAILDLVRTFTVQERRLGLMIGGKGTIGCWNYNIMAPWYYLERNHFVDANIEEALDEAISDFLSDSFGITGPATPQEAAEVMRTRNNFINNHLIADKFGIGDTRVYFDYPILNREKFQMRGGFLSTVPTAFAFKKGLRGTSLHREINRPTLDITGLFSALQAKQSPTQALDYAIAFLDNLGAMLLDTPLGNGGHFGLGAYVKNKSELRSFVKQRWAENVTMRSFVSLEYLFPATEWRSFRVPVNESLFNAFNFNVTGLTNSSEDQNLINTTYAFVQHQLTDRLFPIALQTRVHPGIVFRWSSQLRYEGECKGFTLGTDTYVRNKEKFSDIEGSFITKHMIDELNARSPLAYQSKVVGSVFFKIDKPETAWVISLMGDYTFMNKGIGIDFTLMLNTNVAF